MRNGNEENEFAAWRKSIGCHSIQNEHAYSRQTNNKILCKFSTDGAKWEIFRNLCFLCRQKTASLSQIGERERKWWHAKKKSYTHYTHRERKRQQVLRTQLVKLFISTDNNIATHDIRHCQKYWILLVYIRCYLAFWLSHFYRYFVYIKTINAHVHRILMSYSVKCAHFVWHRNVVCEMHIYCIYFRFLYRNSQNEMKQNWYLLASNFDSVDSLAKTFSLIFELK